MKRLVFSSLLFLFLYLPVVLLIYYVTPLRWRNGVLLVFNLIFYGWGEPVYIVIMFLSTAIDYTHGMLVERYKRRDDDPGRPAGGVLLGGIQPGAAFLFQVLGLCRREPGRPLGCPSCPFWA